MQDLITACFQSEDPHRISHVFRGLFRGLPLILGANAVD